MNAGDFLTYLINGDKIVIEKISENQHRGISNGIFLGDIKHSDINQLEKKLDLILSFLQKQNSAL